MNFKLIWGVAVLVKFPGKASYWSMTRGRGPPVKKATGPLTINQPGSWQTGFSSSCPSGLLYTPEGPGHRTQDPASSCNLHSAEGEYQPRTLHPLLSQSSGHGNYSLLIRFILFYCLKYLPFSCLPFQPYVVHMSPFCSQQG